MVALEKNIMKPRSFKKRPRSEKEFDERVIEIARVSRVVKGGRRIRFRALVVIGDRKGKIGMGVARANEVADAVKKAVSQAKKKMVEVPTVEGTIPYEVTASHGAARVILKPAAPGTSIVAGGAVRAVAELAGVTDILAKILGTRNKVNNVYAVVKALSSFDPKYVEMARAAAKKAEKKEIKKEDKKEKKSEAKKTEEKKTKKEKEDKPKEEKKSKTKKTTKKKASDKS